MTVATPSPDALGSCEACVEDRMDPPRPATHVAHGPEGPYAACDLPSHTVTAATGADRG